MKEEKPEMKRQFKPQDTNYRPIGEISISVYGRAACNMTNRRDVARGLHAIKISNRWMTTEAAYREFKDNQAQRAVERMNGTKMKATATATRSESERNKRIAQAKRELAAP
jgi:hypothetical protein